MAIKRSLNNKRGEGQVGVLTHLIIAVLIFSGISVGMSAFVGGLANAYNTQTNTSDISSYLDKSALIAANINTTDSIMATNTSASVGGSGLFTPSFRITRAFETLNIIGSAGTVATGLASDVASMPEMSGRVPTWFITMTAATISTFLVLVIVSIFTGRRI
tara:strand:- start:360 stop:842 length:483 start_codon:yes stop_codon:yes gene_type:complete